MSLNAASGAEAAVARVYVGIGSNMERERHVRSGIAELDKHFGPLIISTVYANPAVGFAGADFFNLVAGFDTPVDVHTLMGRLREIEFAHGRVPCSPKFSSRTLDLDLLLYDDLVLEEGGLRIPREDIVRHAFVLRPLAEIAAERRHPVLGITFAELWQAFAGDCHLRSIILDL